MVVLTVGGLTLTAGPTLGQMGTTSTPGAGVDNSSATPGAEVASALTVEGTLLEGELQEGTLDVKLAEAAGDEERAAIVATTIQQLNGRLTQLETQAQRFQATRDQQNNVPATLEYAPITTEARTIDHLLERLQTAATELPASQFEAQYTNATSIEQLDARTDALITGEPVSTTIQEPTTSTPSTTTTASPTTPSADAPTSATESTSDSGNDTDPASTDDEDDADDGDSEDDDDENDEDDDADDNDQ